MQHELRGEVGGCWEGYTSNYFVMAWLRSASWPLNGGVTGRWQGMDKMAENTGQWGGRKSRARGEWIDEELQRDLMRDNEDKKA
jgi:hypothetical protein